MNISGKLFACILLLSGQSTRAFCQNLVENGSFELHKPLKCSYCYDALEFAAIMEGWRGNLTWPGIICDSRFDYSKDAQQAQICNTSKVAAFDGHTKMQMEYLPSWGGTDNLLRGNGSYLSTKLKQKLEVGKVYTVSFKIYIEDSYKGYEPFIGCRFLNSVVSNPTKALLNGPALVIDKIEYNRWYQISSNIRPLCEFNQLVLGVFKGQGNRPPQINTYARGIFYLDDIRVVEQTTTLEDSAMTYAPCFFQTSNVEDTLPLELSKTVCFFKSGSYELLESEKSKLDAFANEAKKDQNKTFYITGHTDSIGSNHIELSNQRTQSALLYLQSVHKIPPFRFIAMPLGVTSPCAKTDQEATNGDQRRIEISQTNCRIEEVLYFHVIAQAQLKNMEESFRLLRRWLAVTKNKYGNLALVDPRLKALSVLPQWNLITSTVNERYSNVANPIAAKLLDSIRIEDQWCRGLLKEIEHLAIVPTLLLDKDQFLIASPECSSQKLSTDINRHYEYLQKTFGNDYFPNISEVGIEGVEGFFAVIQHHTDVAVLKKYLLIIHTRCLQGECPWILYAAIYDRVCTHEDKPQMYGTQMITNAEKKTQFYPIHDPTNLNERRKALGLVPIFIE
jgi:flagellar motor protein MotB